MPVADEMQLLPSSPKVGPVGCEDGAGRLPVDTVEKALDNRTTHDLAKLRKRGAAQPPQRSPRHQSPAALAERKSQTADHVRSFRQVKVAELCSTLPNQELPAEVPPRPEPYRERYPCGLPPIAPPRLKPRPDGRSGGPSQITTTACSGSGEAAPEPTSAREDGVLRQKPSVTSVARFPSLKEGHVAPGMEPQDAGEGRPSAGGPGPCEGHAFVGTPDAQISATVLVSHPGHLHTSAKEISHMGHEAMTPASQNPTAPVALKASAPVSLSPFDPMPKAAAGISDGPAKLERRPPPLEDVIRRAEPVTGCSDDGSQAQVDPSLSEGLTKHGAGARDVRIGQSAALLGGEVPAIDTGEPPGCAALSHQPLPSRKEARNPGEGGASGLTGAKEAPNSVVAGPNQTLENAGVAGAIHMKTTRDVSACSEPHASGTEGGETGDPKRGPAPKVKVGRLEDVFPASLAPRGGGISKRRSPKKQRIGVNAGPSEANRRRRKAPPSDPTMPAPHVPGAAEGAGRLQHALSLPLARVAKSTPADEGPRTAGRETGYPAISAERQGARSALGGIAADQPLVGVWGQRRKRQMTRRRLDPSGGASCVERTSADGARAPPRVEMEPPGRRLTVKIGERRFGDAAASIEDSRIEDRDVPYNTERTSADEASDSPRLEVEPSGRRLTVKIRNRCFGVAPASLEDSPRAVPCDEMSNAPRLEVEPPGRNLTVKIDERRFGEAAASGEDSTRGVPYKTERTSADGASAPPSSGVEPSGRRLTVKIGDRSFGRASASGEDSPRGVPCVETTSADGGSVSPRLGLEPTGQRMTVKLGDQRFGGDSKEGSPSSVVAPLSAKSRCAPSRFSRELNALLSTPSQPDKGAPAEGVAKPAGSRSRKGLKQCAQPLAETNEASENATSTQVQGSGLGVANPPAESHRGAAEGGAVGGQERSGDGKGESTQVRGSGIGVSNPPAESQRNLGAAAGGTVGAAERSGNGKADLSPCEEVDQELPAAMPRPKLRQLRKAKPPAESKRNCGAAAGGAAGAAERSGDGKGESTQLRGSGYGVANPPAESQRNRGTAAGVAAGAAERSADGKGESTQVLGSGLGAATPPAETERNRGTAAGGPARATEISGNGKADLSPCEEVEQELPAAIPRPKLRRLRKASELGRSNQPDQVHVDGAKAIQEDDRGTSRDQEVPGPGEATSGGRDAPGSPDREASNNEADVPLPQPAVESYYEPSEEVPLTYEVFERLYLTRGYITMLTRTLRSEIEETFLKAVKGRFVRRREGGARPQHWLRLVVDAKWPLPPRQSKEERVKPVLILEDGSHQTVEGLSDEPARNVWALPEAAVLWHRTGRRGRGLPDSSVPLTSTVVETACFRSRIYVNLAAIKRVKDKDLRERHMRTLGRFLKDRAHPPQQLLQACRVPRPPSRYFEEADALMAKFNSVLAPRTWQPSRSPSLDRDGGAESPVRFYSPEPDAPEGEVLAAPVAQPIPAHATGPRPTPASSPGPQGQEGQPVKMELHADVPAQAAKTARAVQGEGKLDSPVDAFGKELPKSGAPAREDFRKVINTGNKITLPQVPGQSHGLGKEVGTPPRLQDCLSMEVALLLESLAKLSLDGPPVFPLDHGMRDEARIRGDGKKVKRKWDEVPLNHAMHDKPVTPLDEQVGEHKQEKLPPAATDRRAIGRGFPPIKRSQPNKRYPLPIKRSPPIKRIRRTPVRDLSLHQRSPSASSASRDRAARRRRSTSLPRRRSGSSETPRDRKQGREERRRSRSRGQQRARSSSREGYARQKKSWDARHKGRSPPHKPEGFRKPGRDGQRARPRSATRERDSRGNRPSYTDGRQRDGREDGKRRQRSSSGEANRGRNRRDWVDVRSKARDNRRRSASRSREGDRRDRSRDRRSRGREKSSASDSCGSYARELGPTNQCLPRKPSPPVADPSFDVCIGEDIPVTASRPTSHQGQDCGNAIRHAATSWASTLAANGEQAKLPPPPPLPASAPCPPPLGLSVPRHLRGNGAAVTAIPQGATQGPMDSANTQPPPPSILGTEARQALANKALPLPLADQTMAADLRSGTAAAPPIQVVHNVKSCPPLNSSGGQSQGPPNPTRQRPPPQRRDPLGGDAPSLPLAPISGAEHFRAGASCSEPGAQPGGAIPKPHAAEDGGALPASAPLSRPHPWHRPAATGGPPTPNVAAASALDGRNAGGVAQSRSWQQTPNVSTPWPTPGVSSGEGYLLPSGDAASHTPSYYYNNQYGYGPRQTPHWQAHAGPPGHTNPYACPPYVTHPYLPSGENLGYPYHVGHGHLMPPQYPQSAHGGPPDFYFATSHAAAVHPGRDFDPRRRAPVPGRRAPPGELLPPTRPDASDAFAAVVVFKDEPNPSGKVGVAAGDADVEQDADPPGISCPQTLDRDPTALALAPVHSVNASISQPARTSARRVVRRVMPDTDARPDPSISAGPSDACHPAPRELALLPASVVPSLGAAHSTALTGSLLKQREAPGFCQLSENIALMLLKGYQTPKWKPDALSVERLVELSKKPESVQEAIVKEMFSKVMQTRNSLKVKDMYLIMAMGKFRNT